MSRAPAAAGTRLPPGTVAWFEMVGTLMREAATRAGLAPDLRLSLVERYTDGVELAPGRVQGIRFDIVDGRPSFRVGALPGETADITLEVTAAVAQELNGLRSADPRYRQAHARALRTGAMRVRGDPSRLGAWLEPVHDAIVERTARPSSFSASTSSAASAP